MNTTQILNISYWISDLLREELVYCCLLLAFLFYDPTMTVLLCRLGLWTERLKLWMWLANPKRVWKMLVMFTAFFKANYLGKGFLKVLGLFVPEPTVAQPVKPLEPGKVKESGEKERLETILEVDEEGGSDQVARTDEVERPDEVDEPPAPAPIRPQQDGGGNRGKKPKNKKNKRKGKR
ncbi:hypothetical protein HER10_EVM0008557 [Colletotrichum scovillei]|uniref:uncharacterized protein n=1 Tax=Colletotrichum scovillei TaxID=1209932 RepID=UPI0015C3D6D8|nr:uncharacterized protein HER10_EVM0008557 [Colletotrichum scovillei]KAF4781200.1 hypothetical protein HER10_EVM0008557 [Colletotrichum scovillei]